MLHPFFKNYKFLPNDRANTRLRNKLISDLAEELEMSAIYRNLAANKQQSTNEGTSIARFKVLQKFFSDEDDTNCGEDHVPILSGEEIIRNYLYFKDDTLESLTKFPLLVPLFIKYNTALLSSGAAERLFSSGKNVLKLNRCSVSDDHFENQLLLKVNKY